MYPMAEESAQPTPRRWKVYRNIITATLLLICIVLSTYQSVLSTIRFHDYPITVSLSERDVGYDDYPYIVICNKAYLRNRNIPGIPSGSSFMSFYKELRQLNSLDAKDYPWGSLTLKTFYESQIFNSPMTFYKTFYNFLDQDVNTNSITVTPKPIYTAAAGMCTYQKPWPKGRKIRKLEIVETRDTDGEIMVTFVDDLKKIPKLFDQYNEDVTFMLFDKDTNKKFTIGIKKDTRLSMKGYTCTDKPNYVQNYCLDKCVHDELVANGGVACTLPWFDNITNVEDCNNYEDYRQLTKVLTNVSSQEESVIKCLNKCVPACKNIVYSFSESLLWKPPFQGVAYIEFAFHRSVKQVEEIAAYGLINWVGDVGGIFGIFLGVSIFGLYQQFMPAADK